MESIDLKRLNLTIEESRDIIKFIAQKRGISTKKLLSTIKANLKHKNNEILTTKAHQKATKTHQEATKTHQEAIKIQQVAKTQQKSLKLQNLTYEKPSKLAKRENLTSQKQQIMSKNKKRIEIAREKLK